jgi:hypothetical protein
MGLLCPRRDRQHAYLTDVLHIEHNHDTMNYLSVICPAEYDLYRRSSTGGCPTYAGPSFGEPTSEESA